MKTKAEQIADEIAAKNALIQSVLAKGVEATEDETTAAEAAVAEIESLEAKRQSALSLERKAAEAATLAAKLETEPVNRVPFPTKASASVESKAKTAAFTVPALRGTLKNFKGENAHADAYGFGMWMLGGPLGNQKAAQWCAANGIEVKVHQEGANAGGGYLVPHQFENQLIDLREMYGVFRRNARVVPMSSDTLSVPRRTGGLTAYFLSESDAITASTAGWDRVGLTAKKLGVLARISSELAEDAVISIADYLAGEIAYAQANKEDDCGFNGDGTSTYGRIVGWTNALLNLSATRANIAGLQVGSGNAYSELTLGDFHGVMARLPEYAYKRGNVKWFASNAFYHNVMRKLEFASGGATPEQIANGRDNRTFLGYPVEISQVLPRAEANDQVCCLFGDLALGSIFGDRRATEIALSEHSRFANDEIEIRGTSRFDIVVHDPGNQSATAGSRVAGPVVGLLTAAS